MNSKTTGIWFVIAAVLFGAIFIAQRRLHPAGAQAVPVLPHFRPMAVTDVQVTPAGAPLIRADRTNDNWVLDKPISFPAQPVAIEALLNALQKLAAVSRVNLPDNAKNTGAEFGFNNPQFTLAIESADNRQEIIVGNQTAPGDQVFIRVTGVDGVFVTETRWLDLIPRSADQWRDTSLLSASQGDFDRVVLTNGTKVIELQRNPTNRLWQMVRPLPARADNERIAEALQQLRLAHVTRFVTDDPAADPATFGLQPPSFDLWLGKSTNFATALHTGKNPTDDSTRVYARREGWNTIFTMEKESLAFWHGALNDFRDPRLFEFTAYPAEIEVRNQDTNGNFTLRRQGSNDWSVAGEKFTADAESLQAFIKSLADLRIAEFVKDVVTPADLPAYGLDAPQRQIILRATAGDTNSAIVQLNFGTNQDSKVFVRRSDEDFIYAIGVQNFNRLPEEGWQFRDRNIWNFNVADVTQVTLQQNGRTRQLIHNGLNKWSLAPGSQGIISSGSIEQAMEQLNKLVATGWVADNMPEPEKYGFKPENLQITIELKDGKKFAVDFGTPISNQSALASVMLDGQRWVFVFPPVAYQFVVSYLTVPVPQGGMP